MTPAAVISICSLLISLGTLAVLLVLHTRLSRGLRRQRRHDAT